MNAAADCASVLVLNVTKITRFPQCRDASKYFRH